MTETAYTDNAKAHPAVAAVEPTTPESPWRPMQWMICEGCAASVDADLIGPDGAGVADDGGFYCTSCRWEDGD